MSEPAAEDAAVSKPRKSRNAAARRLERVLALIAEAARQCEEVERKFGENPPPELETVLKLHRVLLFHYTLQVQGKPEVLKEMRDLIKPVMDWAALQEKRKQHALAEQKFRDQTAEKAAQANTLDRGALQPETLEQIERELSLL